MIFIEPPELCIIFIFDYPKICTNRVLEYPKICIPLETEFDLCYNKGRKKNPEAARGKAEMWTARRYILGVFSNKPSKNALETPIEFDYR